MGILSMDSGLPPTVATSAERSARRTGRRRVLRILLLLVGFYIGLCVAIAWQTVRPKPGRITVTPGKYGMHFEAITFFSGDGTRLSGWYVPAPAHPRGVIVLCHGVDSTRVAMLKKARILNRHGYSTLLFDFRARGESGGDRCTIGFREVDDLLAAIRYVQSRPDTQGLPLGVEGESMGGAVALMGAARCPAIRAVVAESPFASLDHALENNFHLLLGGAGPLLGEPTRWIGEKMIGTTCDAIAPVHEIGKIAPRPLLLIQDEADPLCPPAETGALYAAAGHPKTLWSVPDATHIAALSTDPNGFETHLIAFFDASLRSKPSGDSPAVPSAAARSALQARHPQRDDRKRDRGSSSTGSPPVLQ